MAIFRDFLMDFQRKFTFFFHDFGRGGFVKPRKRGPLVLMPGAHGGAPGDLMRIGPWSYSHEVSRVRVTEPRVTRVRVSERHGPILMRSQ